MGSHVVLALLDAGRPVVVVDDLSAGFRWASPPDVPFAEGDIADQALVSRLIAEYRIGAVLHFAGSVVVPDSVADPLRYYLNNTVKSRALLEVAVRSGVPHFVFSSTAAVYGAAGEAPIPEAADKTPINPYGRSKLMTEAMLQDVAAAHDFNYCALRYFNVAGADPRGRAGQSTAGATHLIKVAAEAACGKREAVAVFGDDYPTPDGTGVRDYIHVSDLADAHVAALRGVGRRPEENLVLNCGYGHGASVLQVLESVERVAGVSLTKQKAARRPGDPPSLVADNRAILARLAWRPGFDDLDTIVAHALAWERGLTDRLTRGRN